MPVTQKPVDCDCPEGFALIVLDTLPGSVRMVACMKCGRSDLAEAILTEDTPHDVQRHGYDLYDLSEEARAWASAWPRYVVGNDKRVYLPAAARFETEADLNAAVAAATTVQKGVPLRDTLLSLGIPTTPPPASLPESLEGFVEIWRGMQLTDESPIEELLDAATRWNGPHQLGTEVLARRADLHELAVSLLSSPEQPRRDWGRFLVEEFGLKGPDILGPICAVLGRLKDNMTSEMQRTHATLSKMGADAVDALPALEGAAKRVESSDYYMHKYLVSLIAELREHAA